MRRKRRHNAQSNKRYKIRIMGCIIAVELLMLALVLFWPASPQKDLFQNVVITDSPTVLEAPVITQQAGQPPPPPSPQVPIEVPNDQIIKQKDIKFLEFDGTGTSDSPSLIAGKRGGASGKIYDNPELAPSILYIVEPTVNNKTSNKALIYVSFLVNKEGNVEEATIERILLFDDEGNPTMEVDQIDERVLAATIEAALDWKFRPAKVNGKPVRAYTLQTFTIDY